MNFAIIGASGNVGRKTIEILEKSNLPFKELFLVASPKSAGKKVNIIPIKKPKYTILRAKIFPYDLFARSVIKKAMG